MIIRSTNRINVLLIGLFVVINTVQCQLTAECDNITTPYQPYDTLLNCINSIPFDESVKQQTLTTLSMVLPSYVFIDTLLQSPDPNIPLSVNLTNSLLLINQTTYSTDAAFQDAVVAAIKEAEDANTLYRKPEAPYGISSFALPFQIYSVVTGGTQNIIINADEDLLTAYNSIYSVPISSSSINAATILEIDNQPVLDVLFNFANSSVGFSKDFGARFNLAVDGGLSFERGIYTWRSQDFQAAPSNSSVTLLFQDITGLNQTLSINWIGIYNLSSSLPPPQNNGSMESRMEREKEREKEKREGIVMDEEEERGVIYYEMLDATTAVLRITKFEEENQLEAIKRLEEATCAFKEANIDSLIIDVSSASGNNFCFAMSLINYLFPEYNSFEYEVKHKIKLSGAFDMKGSDLFNQFAEEGSELLNNNATLNQLCQMNPQIVGLFSPCAWNDYDSPLDVYHDDSWFLPGNPLSRGGVSANYSSIFTQNCVANANFFIPGESNSLYLPPNNIILLSDGLCSSSCAAFARFLQLNQRAKTVVAGGVPGTQTSSFTTSPGGEWVSLDYILSLADKYGVTDSSIVPPPLPTTATFQFTARELLGWDGVNTTNVPQEFVYLPADFQIYYSTDPKNKTAVWSQAAVYFEKCAAWQAKACPVLNGKGEIKCKNESFSILNPVCVIVSCNPGYELSTDLGTCFPCDAGYYKTGFGLGPCTPCYQNLPKNCQFTETGATAPTCPFACGDCLPCTIKPGGIVDVNSVCLEPWAFWLVLFGTIVGSFILATLTSIFLIIRAVKREELLAAQRKPFNH